MKKFSVFIILCFLSHTLISQNTFSHAVGVSGFFGHRKAKMYSVGLTYSPRLNLLEIGKSSTLSFSTNFGIGYNLGRFEKFTNDNQITFHIPFTLDFNFGLASSKNSKSQKNGGFLGLGYSFEQTGRTLRNSTGNVVIKDWMTGPVANAGYRFKIGSQPFGVRISYLYGTGDFSGGYVTNLSFQYIF